MWASGYPQLPELSTVPSTPRFPSVQTDRLALRGAPGEGGGRDSRVCAHAYARACVRACGGLGGSVGVVDERRAEAFLEVAEAGWRWVLDQVRWDGVGPWIPESVPGELKPEYRDSMHSGIGSLGLTLADVRL